MVSYIWPILLVVGANTVYHICSRSTPKDLNAFASLAVTYLTAGLLSAVLFFITARQKNIFAELTKMNWTSVVLGIVIIGLEFGWLNVYRAGWKVSVGSLVANVGLACVLILVGLLLYKEAISLRQTIGMVICAAGLVLVMM